MDGAESAAAEAAAAREARKRGGGRGYAPPKTARGAETEVRPGRKSRRACAGQGAGEAHEWPKLMREHKR